MSERPTPRRRLFGWKTKLLGLLILAGVLVYFAPAIVAKTPLRSRVIALATADVRGKITAGDAHLSWFGEPELRDAELRDEEGRLIVQAPSIRLGRTLIGLLLNQSDLGSIIIEKPQIDLVVSGDETNLERALAAYLEGEESSAPRTALALELSEARLKVHDQDTGGTWEAGEVLGVVTIPAEPTEAIKFACRGTLLGARPTKLELAIEYRSGRGGQGRPPQVLVGAKAEALPAAAVAAFLRRFEPGLRLDGMVTGYMTLVWDDTNPDQPALRVNGHLIGHDVAITDPRLSDERVQLAALDLPCNFSWSGDKITSEGIVLKCDIGQASLNGTIDLSRGALAVLETPGITATCDLDLAKLSRLLSKPMRLQSGTRVTAGRLSGEVRSTSAEGGVNWTGKLLAVDLRGEHEGQPIAWDNAISADFVARQVPGALPQIDRCLITSDFGRLEASGTEDQFTVGGQLDLAALGRRLERFIDLGDTRPSGKANGRLTLKRERTGAFAVGGEVRLSDLAITLANGSLREPDLLLKVQAEGRVNGPAYRVSTGELHLIAGSDHVDLELLEPINDLAHARDGYVRASLQGDLTRWRRWLAQVITLPADWQLAGAAEGSARLRLRAETLDVDSAQASLTNLRFSGAGLNIIEPSVTLKPGSVKWDRKSRRLELTEAEVTSSALGVRLNTCTVDWTSGGLVAVAKGRLAGDAGRLQQWLPPLISEPVAGAIDGPFDVRAEGGRVSGGVELNARGVVIGDPANPTWNESLVRVIAKGRFEPAADLAVLDNFRIESTALGVAAAGRLARLGTTRDLLLTGELVYDLERFEPQLRRLLGKDARIVGRDRQPFRLEGSLAGQKSTGLAALKGEAAFNWKELNALGCVVGPATLQAKMLGDGWVRFTPVQTTFNQGTLKIEPYIRLEPAPALLAFGKATGVERAKLTPDLSSGSLGYAAPFFAGLRDPQGEVSLVIDGGHLPLNDPDKADIWGKFIVHTARATPGPLLTQLGTLLKTPVNLNLTHELNVPFRVLNGRVYHENLELPLGDTQVKTSGSVGLDGSLNLVAEVTLPPKWFKNPPKTPPVVTLPISGTLSSPRIDERGLQQALAERVTEAATEALKKEAEKGLQKLLQPNKK